MTYTNWSRLVYTQATKKRVSKGEYLLGSGFPIGASSIPVGTRFSVGKSSVLYLCGADGSRNCSTPCKVWLQLRRSGGKGCPLRGSISDRKRLAGGAGKHCLSAVSFAEQRYIKAPVSRCFPSYQNHHGSFPRRLSIASHSTFLSGSRSSRNEMPRRPVFDAIGKAIAVQKIGLPLVAGIPLLLRVAQSGLDELRSRVNNDLPLRDEQYSAQLRRPLLRIEAKFYVSSLAILLRMYHNRLIRENGCMYLASGWKDYEALKADGGCRSAGRFPMAGTRSMCGPWALSTRARFPTYADLWFGTTAFQKEKYRCRNRN